MNKQELKTKLEDLKGKIIDIGRSLWLRPKEKKDKTIRGNNKTRRLLEQYRKCEYY